jgi:glycosyltransferase involved in cell wall biosynthesis
VTIPFDIVIATRDRPAPLAALLGDLGRLSPRPDRIVLVDDSHSTERWKERFPELPLDTVRPDGRALISRAKNLGWARCRSEFVAFVDDDNRVTPELFARLSEDLAQHRNWGAVMPGVLYHRRPELVWVYATPFRPNRWGFALLGRNAPRARALEGRILPTDALPNLSMVSVDALRNVNGFDERLPFNSSADLCQRIKRTGREVYADTGVLTRHDVEPPGVPGYWAEHTVQNPERCRLEVADWFRFHRRWNGDHTLFGVRASYHAVGFIVPKLLAAGIRPDGRPVPLLAAMLSGWREGLASSREAGFAAPI